MQLQEFEKLMNQYAGWTFPSRYYKSIIEPVYIATNDDKIAFVKFCAEKDLNGIQFLKRYIYTVEDLSRFGMTISQIYMVLRMLDEKETKINNLESLVKRQQTMFTSIQERLISIQSILTGPDLP